jgi:hypothetical protein
MKLDIRYQAILALCLIVFLVGIPIQISFAQTTTSRWSTPERLSGENGQASQGHMVSDQFGYVHVFWSETGSDGYLGIQYSRFDGETWSLPNDIISSSRDGMIVFLSPYVDDEGILHLIWAQSNTGPILYSKAPAHNAGSAQAWSKPIRINASALRGELEIDNQGSMHILYSDFYGETPGVYYIRSDNGGDSWSSPLWLDPDIPEEFAPTNVSFEMDDQDGLHALWLYVNPTTTIGQWIRYARSVDGGDTWSSPMTIDIADESEDELRLPYPEFQVEGNEVHVIWAGDRQTHREHRYSLNNGQSWSPTTRIMGDLVGQALGGGVEFDPEGRLHYVTQIRYPQGIYHTYWDSGSWSIPSLIYFILGGANESFGDRVHAHNVRLAIRNGNQLVVTFTSSPTDPQMVLYEMHMTLNDVPGTEPLPTPTTVPTTIPSPTPPSATVESTPDTTITNGLDAKSATVYRPANGIWWALLTSLVILVGFVAFRILMKR